MIGRCGDNDYGIAAIKIERLVRRKIRIREAGIKCPTCQTSRVGFQRIALFSIPTCMILIVFFFGSVSNGDHKSTTKSAAIGGTDIIFFG